MDRRGKRDAGWLVDDSYEQVGDLAETLALLLDDPEQLATDIALADWIEQQLLAVANQDVEHRRAVVTDAWRRLRFDERLLFNKLLTGALRVGVSQRLVQQALAEMSGSTSPHRATHARAWTPTPAFLRDLLSMESWRPIATTLSVLPRLAARRRSRKPGRPERLATGMEMGRHPPAADPPRQRGSRCGRAARTADGRFPEIEAALRRCRAPASSTATARLARRRCAVPFTALNPHQRRKPGPKTCSHTVRVQVYDLAGTGREDARAPLSSAVLRSKHDRTRTGDRRILLSPGSRQRIGTKRWSAGGARERGVEGLMSSV